MSEKVIGKFIKTKKDRIYVATKSGRRLVPHNAAGYSVRNIRGFIEDSLKNMDVERIDLLQLHCPPTDVYYQPELFFALDRMIQEGKLLHYGVSVERIEEALKAMDYPGVASVQIIFNMFRQRPAELFFEQARKRNVGVIVRVPLASGLLTGKFSKASTFGKEDHRFFNRDGQAFDKGETFSGVDYELGLAAVEELKSLFGTEQIAAWALRWILMFDAVSCIIPGASAPDQVDANVAVSGLPGLTAGQMEAVKAVYEKYIKNPVHYGW
jgi:aryl-alcohol dehydrogenase-like predicted oxidoreductase